MKKFLLGITLPTIIGVCVLLWPRPTAADINCSALPAHEQIVVSAFDLIQHSDELQQELYKANRNVAKSALEESPDCLVCKAAALLALRALDESWADTIGETYDDDELDQAIAQVLWDSDHR